MSHRYQKAHYFLNAHHLKQLPADSGYEVAFAGRSNAGKSSAINALTRQKALARTSKTPGRTQQIVLFNLDEQRRLVDLPGYGYAKVPLDVKEHWQKTLSRYLYERACLRGLMLMMDVRHPLTDFDQQMLHWCQQRVMPTHILLTKADKLKFGQAKQALHQVTQYLQKMQFDGQVQLFSALQRQGLDEAWACLDKWFDWETK